MSASDKSPAMLMVGHGLRMAAAAAFIASMDMAAPEPIREERHSPESKEHKDLRESRQQRRQQQRASRKANRR